MLQIDSSIFLQNINKLTRQLFSLFEKSTTFWDNPRSLVFFMESVNILAEFCGWEDWLWFYFNGNPED